MIHSYTRSTDDAKWYCFYPAINISLINTKPADKLLNREEIAKFLLISLVTLTDWVKRGLPSHKQRGRVYFDIKEVLSYIREKKINILSVTMKLN